MVDDIIPEDIRQFLLQHIESIAQWEGLLLMRADPAVVWSAAAIAARTVITKRPECSGLFYSRRDFQRAFFVELADIVPVHKAVDERLKVFLARVAVIDVIGMLPHIDAQNRRLAVRHRVFAVRGFRDFQLAGFIVLREPGPA